MRSVGLVVMLLVGSAAMHGQEQGGASQTAPAAGGDKEVKILGSAGTRIKAGSAVTAARLISRVDPVYPPLARQTRISGTVRLRAIIGKDGSVLELSVLSGHPLLIQSALEAVRQWKYTPTLVGGEPVEVETTIDVIFSLNETSNRTGVKQAPQIDPQVRADFSKLLELTKTSERAGEATKKALQPLRPLLFKTVHDERERQQLMDWYEQKLMALYQSDAFREGMITAYAKYFNDDDAKALIAFYETPTGQKFNAVMPEFTADLIELGQRLSADRMPAIIKELCSEHPELAGQLPDCAAKEGDKKSEQRAPGAGTEAPTGLREE